MSALLLGASSGCGVVGGSGNKPTPTPTATMTATATRTATSTPTSTSTPTLTPAPTPRPPRPTGDVVVAQGHAAVIRVAGEAASAVAYVKGEAIPMLQEPGGFWGVYGAAATEPTGQFPITIDLLDSSGNVISELSQTLAVYEVDYPVEYITLPPSSVAILADPTSGPREQAIRDQVFATSAPEQLWSGQFSLPVDVVPVTDSYGVSRSYNGGPVGDFHHGTDFAVDEGTPVHAAAAGRVAFAGAMPIRGNSVIIDHGGGVFTGYHHLSSMSVSVGQSVGQGEVIGNSGATGLVTGPHLHWEVVVQGVSVDPLQWNNDNIGP